MCAARCTWPTHTWIVECVMYLCLWHLDSRGVASPVQRRKTKCEARGINNLFSIHADCDIFHKEGQKALFVAVTCSAKGNVRSHRRRKPLENPFKTTINFFGMCIQTNVIKWSTRVERRQEASSTSPLQYVKDSTIMQKPQKENASSTRTDLSRCEVPVRLRGRLHPVVWGWCGSPLRQCLCAWRRHAKDWCQVRQSPDDS